MTVGTGLTRIVLVELAGSARTAVDRQAPAPGVVAVRVARALRDEGAEVIHAGALRSFREIVATVEQEDPAVVLFVVGPGNDCEGNVGDCAAGGVDGDAGNGIAEMPRDPEKAGKVDYDNNADNCSADEIVDRASALFDDRRVAVIATDTDVANWVKASAICATDPSSEGYR
ncbi:hypothetical protein [Prauserella marina]|uniref:hypothetical protein n=1 Tax=Prauserella marina TaxID=530584 RepID=UPI00115FC9FC|nr:hypothetical protein [Prauserella marina]